MEINRVHCGDALETLRGIPDETFQTTITSPPYWALRDYGAAGQMGMETTPEEYLDKMVAVFEEVRRATRPDGTLWLNMGDAYCGYKGENYQKSKQDLDPRRRGHVPKSHDVGSPRTCGFKNKDLMGMPWRLALALQAAGWYLRMDIIWYKPNPMPESVNDRPTRAHEYVFLLAKEERYFYDADAVREPLSESTIARLTQPTFDRQTGGEKDYGRMTNANRSARKALCNLKEKFVAQEKWGDRHEGWKNRDPRIRRNKRSVWEIATRAFDGAHFATFPEELVEPCVLAGSRPGDLVLDPFAGSGTTGEVAIRLGRNFYGIDINPQYCQELAGPRLEAARRGQTLEQYRAGQGVLFGRETA